MTRIHISAAGALLAVLLLVRVASASPPDDLQRLFATKPHWEFPRLKSSPELDRAARAAIRNYRAVDPEVKIALTGIHHDPRRRLAFLTFGVAKDSLVIQTDFFLVYVYDHATHRLLGHVFINMA